MPVPPAPAEVPASPVPPVPAEVPAVPVPPVPAEVPAAPAAPPAAPAAPPSPVQVTSTESVLPVHCVSLSETVNVTVEVPAALQVNVALSELRSRARLP